MGSLLLVHHTVLEFFLAQYSITENLLFLLNGLVISWGEHVLLDRSCVGLTRVLCCSEESSTKGLVSMNSWRSRANCKERLDLVGLRACTTFFFPKYF